jgi:hypothetical protein
MKGVPGASRGRGACHRHKETQKSTDLRGKWVSGRIATLPCGSRLVRDESAVDLSFRGPSGDLFGLPEGGFLRVRFSMADRSAARIAPPLYLRDRAAMREAQPSAQLTRGLVGCTPVKRHQCPRTTGYSSDLGPPLIPADQGHFDVVFATIDGFFEAMNGERHATRYEAKSMNWAANPPRILRIWGGGRKRKESRRRIHMQHGSANRNNARKKIRVMSECPQAFHCSSTCFPQPRCARFLPR